MRARPSLELVPTATDPPPPPVGSWPEPETSWALLLRSLAAHKLVWGHITGKACME